MEKSEHELKLERLDAEEFEFGLSERRKLAPVEFKTVEQEIVRRNIEVCLSVMKVAKVAQISSLENEAATKVSEFLKVLSL